MSRPRDREVVEIEHPTADETRVIYRRFCTSSRSSRGIAHVGARQHQDAIRDLSTPVLQVRKRLLILPHPGLLDAQRAHQLADQLLRGIRAHRAKVVVLDITGVADVDEAVADHLTGTVDASGLIGAAVIVTGLSAEIAQALVAIGADISKLNTAGTCKAASRRPNISWAWHWSAPTERKIDPPTPEPRQCWTPGHEP